MNSFDDIFDTPLQQAQEYQPDAPFDKDAWKVKKQAERAAAYEIIDNAALEVGTNGKMFQTYLNVQGHFDRYSVANALLIAAQRPASTRLGDFSYWKEQNAYVGKNQKSITILEPGNEYTREDGSIGVSYNPKKVFDVSQTSLRQKSQVTTQRDERVLIKALINKAPVAIRAVETMPEYVPDSLGAIYDLKDQEILVRRGMEGSDIFRSIANELAHVAYADGDPTYDRNANGFKAYSVSYMLCKKYGIDTKGYSFDRLPDSYIDMDAQAIRGELSQIRDTAGDISARMNKVLEQGKSPRKQSHER